MSPKLLKSERKKSNLHQKDNAFFVEKRKNILLFDENADIIMASTNCTKIFV